MRKFVEVQMQKKFISHGCSYDVEYFQTENSCMIRFYDSKNEEYGKSPA